MLRSIKDLQEFTIRAVDGEIGRVDQLLFDDAVWTLRYVAVDTGRWLPGRRVLVSPRAITSVDPHARTLDLNLTREKIRDSPDVDAHMPVSRQKEAELHDYYGYPYYWGYLGGAGSWAAWSHPPGAIMPPDPELAPGGPHEAAAESDGTAEPHLRSTKEVAGYAVYARDGDAGTVEDFVVSDAEWEIRYLVVRTGTWFGRDVLVAPAQVSRIDWETSTVQLALGRDEVKAARRFDARELVNGDSAAGARSDHGRQDRSGHDG